ncbi:uncharacterized protein Tco025E_07008 [Trypanosoma conorhini]|uniref:CUE domain-containing protein n=1 Tax=Trypanosoma conorhini TaxID=83891 RepID=A0A422NV85_9TRYP|nr:uncharacterized protein Tco025E_07008 [Trypanosoma conorhini]RNF09383.1 hypothetical protein Tco025E_07008 [Trypanosoma conorhini]
MESSATTGAKRLSRVDEIRLMEALFPYASSQSLSEAVRATNGVEEAIFHLNATANPDLDSASYLLKMKRKTAISAEVTSPTTAAKAAPPPNSAAIVVDGDGNAMSPSLQDTFAALQSHLFSRLALFDEKTGTLEVNQQNEYNATVAVFPIDTAAWDDHFITSATLTDVMGAHPLVLPTSAEAAFSQTELGEGWDGIQAPIVRWAPTAAALKKERNENRATLSEKEISSLVCILQSEGEEGGAIARERNGMGTKNGTLIVDPAESPTASVGRILPTPLQYRVREECELRVILDELEARGGEAFHKMGGTNLCKEIVKHCKTLTGILPEYFPKLLRVIGKELEGEELLPALQNVRLKAFGEAVLNTGAVRVREIAFGRSYARFSENGEHLLWRVKLKYLALDPASFTLTKAEGRGDVKRGTVSAKIKDLKVKAKLTLRLLSTGRLNATCCDPHVSIGSLHTKCSVCSLNALGFFLRPFLKQKLCLYLIEMLREGIALNPG